MAHHPPQDGVPSSFIGIVADQAGTYLNSIHNAEQRYACLLPSRSVLDVLRSIRKIPSALFHWPFSVFSAGRPPWKDISYIRIHFPARLTPAWTIPGPFTRISTGRWFSAS